MAEAGNSMVQLYQLVRQRVLDIGAWAHNACLVALRRVFGGEVAAPAPALPPTSEPGPSDERWDNPYEFSLRGSILDDLDKHFTILARMRRGDNENYQLFSRIGACIVKMTDEQDGSKVAVNEYFLQAMPAFGAVVFSRQIDKVKVDDPDKKRGDHIAPKMCYFHKYSPKGAPSEVQPVNGGHVYIMTTYWDEFLERERRGRGWKKSKGGTPTQFAVWVAPDGHLSALKVTSVEAVPIRHKKGKLRGTVSYIHRQQWGYGNWYNEWSEEKSRPTNEFLLDLFRLVTHDYVRSQSSMFRVNVSKGELTTTFCIPERRSAYFFRDREFEANVAGTRKRIFHIVKAHTRVNGATVRLHFRGAREFEWNGYRITITVPGLHHEPIVEFNVDAIDEEHWDGEGKVMTQKDVGNLLKGHIATGQFKGFKAGVRDKWGFGHR